MRPKILGIQFRENPASMAQERACIEREVGIYCDLEYVVATDGSVDWEHPEALMQVYSAVIIGGSSEFYFDGGKDKEDNARKTSYVFLERFSPLFKYIFDNDIPTLGICYGHQLLGAFAGAEVVCDKTQGKTCSHLVKLIVNKQDHFLFSDLPEEFFAHYGHKDSLISVPDGAVLLMNGGDQCRVSALQYKNNIYSTQFHPELSFGDMVDRIKNAPGYLPEGVAAEEIFKDEPHSNLILQNFGKFVAMRSEIGQAAQSAVVIDAATAHSTTTTI
jgi:GMP synthase-like glutamine amidotransferase